jgi:hypothetical protein
MPSVNTSGSVAVAAAAGAGASSSSAAAVAASSGAAGSSSGSGTIPAAGGHAPHVSPYVPAIRNWSGPVHAQLEGPGMPVARSVAAHAVSLAGPGVDGGSGGGGALGPGGGAGGGTPMDIVDGADDGAEADDGRLYCLCQMVSYGDMVACDDDECEREWVSLSLVLGGGARGCWGSCADLSLISSIWGVSGSRWPPRACGFVIRVDLNQRTSARSRGQRPRTGATAVRTGTLARHVHPLRLDCRKKE